MATAIASQEIKDWHGKKIFQHAPVVYLAGEGQKGMRKRCAGLAHHKGIQRKNVKIAILKYAKFGTLQAIIDDRSKLDGEKKTFFNDVARQIG